MLSTEEYIRKSLGYDLFWIRIMKEHAIFIESSIPPSRMPLAKQADQFKQQYEALLAEAINLSNGVIPKEALQSGQYFTRFTEEAELAVQKFTNIDCNVNLTRQEYNIQPSSPHEVINPQLEQMVSDLNQRAISLTKPFASFKSDLYKDQTSCLLFTFLYPADLNHILQEANRYLDILSDLQKKDSNVDQNYRDFWNHNMSDHSKSMRGLFDPTEAENFNKADQFAKLYDNLIRNEATTPLSTDLSTTQNLSAFKANTTQGLLACKIKAIMSALYTDHLLREANHFIYLMQPINP